ncbi:phasin family protein [Sphingomonas crusticola]|uniref:phasin family protein n=1 Tax=Sphingomonas crusticola TaxID=1697973 RepID=UPI001F072FF6|nr:phasin family protein [Sphingomonas crusticola]
MTDKDIAKAKVAAKPRKRAVSKPVAQSKAAKAAIELAAAGEAVAKQLTPSPAQLAENLEAVTSPAIESDPIVAPAADTVEPATIIEEDIKMATVTSPTDAANQAQAAFGDVSNRFKTAFEKSTKIGEELVDFAKGNVEAVIASSKVAAKASESLGQDAAEYGKKHFEAATAAFKSFATVKSPTELFQLQSDFAKASFDSMVAEASRVSETLMKVAGDVAQPISTRYALAAEKIKSTAL